MAFRRVGTGVTFIRGSARELLLKGGEIRGGIFKAVLLTAPHKKMVPPSSSGTQNGKKAIISPCLLGPWPTGAAPDFYTGREKIGSERKVPPSPSGTQNGKKAIISPCLLGPWPTGAAPVFCTGRGNLCRKLMILGTEPHSVLARLGSGFLSVSKSPLSRGFRNTREFG